MVTKIRKGARGHLYIKERMDDCGLNDERVANRIGVARETVTRWRNDPNRLNPGKIAALASALDCEPEELWNLPNANSLDAMVKHAPEEIKAMAVDIVRRLVSGKG